MRWVSPTMLRPCRSPPGMADNAPVGATSPDLTTAWHETQARLPAGWTVDSLRCASSGLDPVQRSDDWIAVAVGPGGEERRHRAPDPIAALAGLAASLEGATRA